VGKWRKMQSSGVIKDTNKRRSNKWNKFPKEVEDRRIKHRKSVGRPGAKWFKSVSLATWEAEIERIMV
jgi:hypothetical protein